MYAIAFLHTTDEIQIMLIFYFENYNFFLCFVKKSYALINLILRMMNESKYGKEIRNSIYVCVKIICMFI